MLSTIVTVLFAVSTVALVVLVYTTVRNTKCKGDSTRDRQPLDPFPAHDTRPGKA